MKRSLIFVVLYIWAALSYLWHEFLKAKAVKSDIRGERVFLFTDPAYPHSGPHGVVAFVLPHGSNPDDFSADLLGPFGLSSRIDLLGLHLYGRDTWGHANKVQIQANPELQEIANLYPGQIILLAGVRKIWGFHPPPLDEASNFTLLYKS